MSYITIAKAAEILGVSKKTLFRWDEEGKFSPKTREKVSKIRLYEEIDVKYLKLVLDNEKRFKEVVKEERALQIELDKYENIFLLSDKQGELLSKAEELRKKREEIVDEFKLYPQEVKNIHKIFFKI